MCMNPLYQVNVSLFTAGHIEYSSEIKYPTSRCYNIVSNADDFVIKLNQNEFRAVSASPDSDFLSNPHRKNMEISNNAITSIQKLWMQGFFGKGNLSRSVPTFEWRNEKKEQITQNRRIARVRRKKNKKNASASITNNEDRKKIIDVNVKKQIKKIDIYENYNNNKDDDDNIIQNQAISIQKHLQLTIEKAFFLCFRLECLEIYNANDNLMTTHDCWNAFHKSSVFNITPNSLQDSPLTQLDNPFILRYVVYLYFLISNLQSHKQIQPSTSSDNGQHYNDDLNNPFKCIKYYKVKEVLIKRCLKGSNKNKNKII
ncbi:hypothetical protein C2G38_2192660 [Gigaspora rosea]|uniref:Uncharacterized protein n=1 Tax=Gigaspora rosea TaxID=44941 RepID=A0A397V153_9GLOM|nr:hypothetical protein C2G38_2192660 [Gigaspora rosea]